MQGLCFALIGMIGGVIINLQVFHTSNGVLVWQLDKHTSAVMRLTLLSKNSTEVVYFDQVMFPKKALVIIYLVLSHFQCFLNIYTILINLLAAVAMYDITSRIDRVICYKANLNIRFLLTCYEQMWGKLNTINEVNSKVMLVVYMYILSWSSVSSVHILEENSWLYRVFVLMYCTLFSSTFIFAAEANRKVSF